MKETGQFRESYLRQNIYINYFKIYYNIASRATQSNSVYVSVLKIPIVHADSMSKAIRQKFFLARAAVVSEGKILYFATIIDAETLPTSPKTKTILRPFYWARVLK